jgi:hypothetical protein
MSALLTDLAGRLGERWLTRLALPGATYLAAAWIAVTLGHAHAGSHHRLTSRTELLAAALAHLSTGPALLVVIAAAAMAAAAAYLAQAIGAMLETLWFADGDSRLLDRLLPTRLLPQARRRLRKDYHVDLATIWPALWLHLTTETRDEVTTARASVRNSAALLGWGLLYAALAAIWWPMLPVTAVLLWVGRRRSWQTMSEFSRVVEATVQVHTGEFAVRLGLAERPLLDRSLGWRLTTHLQNNRKFELTEQQRSDHAVRA